MDSADNDKLANASLRCCKNIFGFGSCSLPKHFCNLMHKAIGRRCSVTCSDEVIGRRI